MAQQSRPEEKLGILNISPHETSGIRDTQVEKHWTEVHLLGVRF